MGRRARVAHEVSEHPARDLLLTAQLDVLGSKRVQVCAHGHDLGPHDAQLLLTRAEGHSVTLVGPLCPLVGMLCRA